MSPRIVVGFLACAVPLTATACGKLADLAGAPDRGVTDVTVLLPGTILVGDTVKAGLKLLNGKGLPPAGDSTTVWRSSDPASVAVDSTGRVVGSAPGAHAVISATVANKVTGSASVSVADDQRIGYALADQPAAAGPYLPDAAYRFNSSGSPIDVTRSSAGAYSVRFDGLGRSAGQRDNVQVSGNAGAGGIFCKLAGWQSSGTDLTADVHCFTPAGAPADSRFTILLSGARVYNPTAPNSRLGFALTPDFASANSAVQLDTSGTTRNNSATHIVNVGHGTAGQYSVQFPGLERGAGAGPITVQVTAVGSGPERCQVIAFIPAQATAGVSCATTGGAAADSRFSILMLQRGRAQTRFGYALADQFNSTVAYQPVSGYVRNPGGTVSARLLSTGHYEVIFQGIARSPGDVDTVILMPWGAEHICTTTTWANSGTTDFAVTLSCFNVSGTPANAQFNVLLLQ